MVRCASILRMAAIWVMWSAAAARAQPPATAPAGGGAPAAVVTLAGPIDDYSRDALKKHLDAAKAAGAKTIIVSIDTYGGLVTAGLDISRMLKRQDADGVRTIAFVKEKAISAGAMVALACDEIYMSPGSLMGDCAPIAVMPGGQGMQPLGAAERAKAESPILADFYDSAVRNGYDPTLVAAMVAVGRSVYYVAPPATATAATTAPATTAPAGPRFVDLADYKLLLDEGWTSVAGVPDPVDSPETLLTVNSDLARKLGLSRGTVSSADALAHQLGLDVVATFERSGGDVLIGMLGSAVVRGILLIIFMQSVYIALHAPGHGAAEAVALVSLGLLLGVPALTGYAQWWEIAMILIGLALLATELFVIPGFGVTGITGLVLMAGGFLMTFVAPEPGRRGFSWPALGATWDAVQTGLFVLTGGLVATVLLSAWLRQFLPKLPYLNRLILTPVAGGAGVMGTNVFTGDDVAATWPAPGAVGRAMTDLRPGGSAMFADPVTGGDRAIAVVSDSGFVAAGAAVEVREVGGNRVLVRAAQA